MANEGSILVLGDPEGRLAELTGRVRALGFSVLCAKTAQDAIAAVEERKIRFSGVLFETDIPAFDLGAALDSLRRHPRADHASILAVGPCPDEEGIARLRDAGVERALWDPIGDHSLRFELNRCFADPHQISDRAELRAPTDWNTRVFVAGRKKPASVYAISSTGAFIATPRPQVRGAKVAVELPLPDGLLSLAGTVVYANVPGNLRKTNLPSGMALRFEDAMPDQLERLRRAVEECAKASLL